MNNKKLTLGLLVLSVMLFVGASNASAQTSFFALNQAGDVARVAEDGTATIFSSGPKSVSGQLWESMTADSAGNLYALNRNGKVMKVASGGSSVLFADLTSVSGNGFWMGITMDPSGSLYAVNFTSQIAKITSAGAVSAVTTSLSSLQASGWTSVMTDGTGNLYVSSYSSGVVAKISSNGSASLFSNLSTLSVYEWYSAMRDSSGNIFAIDSVGNVAKINSAGSAGLLTSGPSGISADGGWREMSVDTNGDLYPFLMSGEIAKVSQDGATVLLNEALRAITADGWTGGLVAVAVSRDIDGDGIENTIDTDPLVASVNFNDGTSFGTVTATGGWTISLTDLPSPDGVRFSVTGSGTVAKILTCNNNVETQLDTAGEVADILCGSTTVTSVNALPDIRVREPQGGTGGKATLVKLTTGQIVKMGSYVAASPLNESEILVEVVDNNDTVLGSGTLNPGETLDIEPNGPNNTVVITNQSSEPVQFTFNGEVLTLAPDETLSLIPDETYFDSCPNSVPDSKPNENRFSWLGGDNFMTRDPKTKELVASPYTLEQVKGCTCAQILEKTSGEEKGQASSGCTKETMEKFIKQNSPLAALYQFGGDLYYMLSGLAASLAAFGLYLARQMGQV